MSTDVRDTLYVVLAIGNFCGPIVFGYFLYRLGKVFLTKIDFEEFKRAIRTDLEEFKQSRHSADIVKDKRFETIETDIKQLIGRHK